MSRSFVRPMSVCWWNEKNNYGDVLFPYLANAYGVPHRSARMDQAEVCGLGSIVEEAAKDLKTSPGVIWTTGTIKPSTRNVDFTFHKVTALRGLRTMDRINMTQQDQDNLVLGDGGLLVGRAYDIYNQYRRPEQVYKIGIVPHYVDHKSVSSHVSMCKSPDVLLIDICQGPKRVTEAIAQCQSILSSSLHGLVAADALGIPSRQFRVSSSQAIVGGQHKYHDYYSVFGIEAPRPFRLHSDTSIPEVISSTRTSGNRQDLQSIVDDLETSLLRLPKDVEDLRTNVSNDSHQQSSKGRN